MLEREQIDALNVLVEASRSVPRDERQPFSYKQVVGERRSVVEHPGLPDQMTLILFEDLQMLEQKGLVTIAREQRSYGTLFVTPEGLHYYESVKQSAVASLRQVEQDVAGYLSSEAFRKHFALAHDKLQRAYDLLWSTDSSKQLSLIGHLCREAMQEFADTLAKSSSEAPGSLSDKSKTVARIRASLATVKSEAVRAFVEALLAFWGTVSDLVQRQEHAGEREVEELTWEDARRVVFQTAIVMYEVARTVFTRAAT